MKSNCLFNQKFFTGAMCVVPIIASGAGLPAASGNTEGAGYLANDRPPNIILILADDLGYGDIGGYFGGEAETPNLNRLAQEGMLFTDFHSNGPMCSPTRAALLTGRYQQRSGIETYLLTRRESQGIGRIHGIGSDANKDEVTMAEYLLNAGYVKGIFGLADDIGESFDLSDQYPEIVRQLKKELEIWEKDVDRK